jgi:hypothetical protein
MDDDDDSEGESDEEDYLNALLGGADSEDEDVEKSLLMRRKR